MLKLEFVYSVSIYYF